MEDRSGGRNEKENEMFSSSVFSSSFSVLCVSRVRRKQQSEAKMLFFSTTWLVNSVPELSPWVGD
jgi:hypothetical protein